MNVYIGGKLSSDAGVYYNSNLGLITVSDGDGNYYTIADKNLGASTVYNTGDTLSESNCGKYFQRGNNYAFSRNGGMTTSGTQVNASNYGPGNYYNSSTFIYSSGDRSSVQNDNLRGNTTDTSTARQGPCASGFHVPSASEALALLNAGISIGAWTASDGSTASTLLKMPFAGGIIGSNGNVLHSTNGGYWTTSPSVSPYNPATECKIMYIKSNEFAIYNDIRSSGLSIRPFKNEAVVPDSNWTKLY